MAYTDITDITNALKNPLLSENILRTSIESSPLLTSGAAMQDPFLNEALTTKAGIAENRFTFMSHPNPNISNDNPNAIATPHSLSSGLQITRPAYLNLPIGYMDIIEDAHGISASDMIAQYFGMYWGVEHDRYALSCALGVLGTSIGTETLILDDSANVFNLTNHLKAVNKLGDRSGKVAIIAAHSALVTRMKILNGTNNIASYQGDLPKNVFSFNGYLVVEDDTIPCNLDTKVATVLYLAKGAIRVGKYIPKAVQLQTNQLAGNGGGMTALISHYHLNVAVPGFSFTNTSSLVDKSVTRAGLEDPDNYTWVYDNDLRQAPLCALKCKFE